MSRLVAIDSVLYDLESCPDGPDGVSALVGEPAREDEGWRASWSLPRRDRRTVHRSDPGAHQPGRMRASPGPRAPPDGGSAASPRSASRARRSRSSFGTRNGPS